MTNRNPTEYFDLHTQGIGYINRVHEVTPESGSAFLSVTIAALWGRVDNAQYTYFECRVTGAKAQEIVRRLQPAVDGKLRVMVGFTVSDLRPETFTFERGRNAGQIGIRLQTQLVRIAWARVEGQSFYSAKAEQAEAA